MSIQEERFTAIANAIREKDGTTAPISANEFAARILAIQDGVGSDFAVPLVVSTSAGAAITAVNGNITVTGTAGADGIAELILTAPGEWEVTASLNGIEKIANVAVAGNYNVEINLNPSRLPDGYTEVEYILPDRQSAINTNFSPNFQNTRIVVDMDVQSYYDNGNFVFMTQGATSYYCVVNVKSAVSVYYRLANNAGVTKSITNKHPKMYVDCNFATGEITINDNTFAFNRLNASVTDKLYLFGANGSALVGKLYSAQIYTGANIMRDFVPCINPSGEVGLYDLVGKQFYGNALSGTFTAGPAIWPAGETTITINVSDAAGAQALVTMLTSTGSLTVAQTKITTANATVTTAESTVEISYTLAKTISKPRNVQVNGVSIGTVSSAGDKASTNIPISESINIHFALA